MEITVEVLADFQEYYPEFNNDSGQAQFAESLLIRSLCEGDEETGGRWGGYAGDCSLKKRGMFAYAAHKASLSGVATRITEGGGVASAVQQVASKSVGDESVSFVDSSSGGSGGGLANGNFGSTIYGQEFLRLRKRAGAGLVVL